MNAGRVLVRREKDRQQLGHGHPRIRHADEDFLRRSKLAGHEDGGGLALFGGGEVGFFFGEGEVAGSGVVGRREAGQFNRAVAEDFAPELFRNLRNCERHGALGLGF